MHPPQLSATVLAALLAAQTGSALLQCDKMVVEGHKFDLSKLGGPHSVVTSSFRSDTHEYTNTTYTLDICKQLKKASGDRSDAQCPKGTRVCAIQRQYKDDKELLGKTIAIAGNLENAGGAAFEYELSRLNGSDSNSDAKKSGLRLQLKGGKDPLDGKEKVTQRAVVEFLCDEKLDGTEGEWESEDKYEKRADDDNEGEGGKEGESFPERQLKKDGAALIWESYGREKGGDDVLRLTWHTKYACESKRDDGDGNEGEAVAHWGFFTWLVIVVFLGIAAYLIFGSWLNYNRYGARGWDLLPHGDTIRDVPYLLKDWTRRVLNTVQGTGSRGGYSAV